MPKALTWETMSPGLLKGGETRSPEPHRRKSRMREIRLSGSGEGLGWATSQPTLQRPFGAATPAARPPAPPAGGHTPSIALPACPARCGSPASAPQRQAQRGLDRRRGMG
jgi:hypothetical protein